MATVVILMTSLFASADIGTKVSAEQFANLIQGLHSPFRDVEFVFEGESKRLDETVDISCRKYQGLFAFRLKDGATYLDIFEHPNDPQLQFMHATYNILHADLQKLVLRPDVKRFGNSPPIRTPGGPSSINLLHHPTRFFYLWQLEELKEDPSAWGYEDQGWEIVDGRRCLRIQFDEGPGLASLGKNRPVISAWIDMERNGQPLKIEYVRMGEIVARTHHIRLDRINLPDGKVFWFPVSGESDNGAADKSSTVSRATSYIVDGSLRFNQNLPDSRFSVFWKATRSDPTNLEKIRREFEFASSRSRPRVLPNDPASVQKRLEESLAEAESQAKQVEASSPSRETIGWTRIGQFVFIALGFVSLVIVAYSKWRNR